MKALASLISLLSLSMALAANPFVFGNVRFTFITDNLVRMEYAQNARFLNDSTLFAINRQVGNVEVTTEKRPDGLRPTEDCYDKFIQQLGADTLRDGVPVFDAGNRRARCLYDDSISGIVVNLPATDIRKPMTITISQPQ